MIGSTTHDVTPTQAAPAGPDRPRSFLTLIVAVVTLAALGGCNTAATSTTTTIRTPRDDTAGLEQPTAPPISELSSIVCTSQDTCVAVGNWVKGVAKVPQVGAVAQTIFPIAATTSDGGAHWATFSLPTRMETLPALSCPSAKSCVAVGGTFVGNDVLGRVVRTSDGGEVWVRSVIPRGVGNLKDVSCPKKTYCVAVGETPDGSKGVALVTTNSGAGWTRLSLPSGEKSLALVDCRSRNNCTMVGGGRSGWGATVITTTDGGRSWAQTSLPQMTSGLVGPDISNGISCPSSTPCFIVGEEAPGDGSPSGLVFTSSNAENLWMSQSVPPGTTGLASISCRTATTCVVVGGGIGPRGEESGAMALTTTDAGITWTRRSVPAAVIGLGSVSCPTVDRCVATGSSSSGTNPSGIQPAVATTSDGGVTWTTSSP